jgi:hypothetical protein
VLKGQLDSKIARKRRIGKSKGLHKRKYAKLEAKKLAKDSELPELLAL